jgi:transcriptional regulator with XRE-family HTH domain
MVAPCVPRKDTLGSMAMSTPTRDLVLKLDAERERQGMTKTQLASRCGMLDTSIRRLFSSSDPDTRVSTLTRIASALGCNLNVIAADHECDDIQKAHFLERMRRVVLAEHEAKKSGLDAGDIEHALYNLTLPLSERLSRRLHARQISK